MEVSRLRERAERAANGDGAALAECAQAVFASAEARIGRALGGNDIDTCEVAVAFLEQRLLDPTYWRKWLNATEPGGYHRGAAYNFTVDWLRKRPDHGLADPTPDSDSEDETVGGEATGSAGRIGGDDSRAPEPALESLRELTAIQRAELKVSFGVMDLFPDEVDAIAARRNVGVDVVRAELARRSSEAEARSSRLEERVETLGATITRLWTRLGRCQRIAADLGDSADAIPASAIELSAFRSDAQLRRASPEERAAVAMRIGARIETCSRKLVEARDRLAKAHVGRPDRRAIAVLVGRVGVDAGEEELDRAANTLWIAARRQADRLKGSE